MRRVVTKLGAASRQGFSLVEVAMSMAIVSFAMVSIMGLLPMGLTNFRQAMNNTIESQIVQSIVNESQLTSFTNLKNGTTLYDADGNLTTSAAQAVYTATVTVTSINGTGSYPVNLVISTGATTGATATCADMVTIALVNRTQPNQPHVYSTIVANQNN